MRIVEWSRSHKKHILWGIGVLLLGVAGGMCSGYAFWEVKTRGLVREVGVVTYDGCQYGSDAYADVNTYISDWVAKSDPSIRENIITVAVYPKRTSQQQVICVVRCNNPEHLETLSREVSHYLKQFPRYASSPRGVSNEN